MSSLFWQRVTDVIVGCFTGCVCKSLKVTPNTKINKLSHILDDLFIVHLYLIQIDYFAECSFVF